MTTKTTKTFLANAFSLQMLDTTTPHNIRVEPVAKIPEGCISAIGHADTAHILGVECNRINLSLNKGDVLYVAQVLGGRLPEGCTKLPEGFRMTFLKVTIL